MSKFLTFAVATALLAAAPMAVQAQDAPAVEVIAGAMVYGPEGGEVGPVDSVEGDIAIVDTGTHKAALPMSAFGKNDKGLSITLTKAQLDQAITDANMKAKQDLLAALVPGAAVTGANGQTLGTIKEVVGELVTIEHEGSPYKLPVETFMAQDNGVGIAMTLEQFKAAISGS